MMRELAARRHGERSLRGVYAVLALSGLGLVFVAANQAPRIGLLATMAEVPMSAVTSFFAAVWSWWHLAAVGVSQACLLAVHAEGLLAHPWFILLSGCVILAVAHAPELRR
jgi:hypothetical protein